VVALGRLPRRIPRPRKIAPAGEDPRAHPPIRLTFTDVTSLAGIRFRHNNGALGRKFLPETMGSGAAFVDVDGDGWRDIFS
jgi:hypothetical protein